MEIPELLKTFHPPPNKRVSHILFLSSFLLFIFLYCPRSFQDCLQSILKKIIKDGNCHGSAASSCACPPHPLVCLIVAYRAAVIVVCESMHKNANATELESFDFSFSDAGKLSVRHENKVPLKSGLSESQMKKD